MIIKQITSNRLEIGENIYTENIVVSSEGIVFNWKKKEIIEKEDLSKFIKENPDLIIVGTNKGLKGVSMEGQKLLKEKEIILVIDKLSEAINVFNKSIKRDRKILAVFPLGQSRA